MGPVDELPVGTVTFLFTDIEGSTRLLKQLRDRYGEALDEHHRILRTAFAEHDGHEIDTQGDSFFVAFRRAKDAVAAAVEGQRRLADHAWPGGAELRVRMGLHTGEPAAAGDRYIGLGVHRAARISAAGHGGQVLVSQATRELLRDDPLPDVSLRDLGEHQLKDLDEPERLYQLVAPGLAESFPPLKTAGAAPFEGREDELAEAAAEQMAASWRRPARRTLVIATFAAAVVGVIAGVLLTQGGGSTASASVQPNSVGVVNPVSGRVSSVVPVGSAPGGVATGANAIWVANTDADTVSRIDAGASQADQTIQVGGGPADVAVGGGSVWTTNGLNGTLSRINPELNDGQVVQTIHVGNGPVGVAYGAGKVWVANSVDGTVTEVVPTTGTVARTLPAIPGATGIVVAYDRVWVVSPSAGTVVSLDPATGEIVDRVGVGIDPVAIAAGDGDIWVANSGDGTVSKIAPKPTAHVSDLIDVGHGPDSIAAVQGGVWVANGGDATLMRIDASNDGVVKVVNLANPPQALAATTDGLYVAVRSSDAAHRGGTLRVRLVTPDFLDPGLAYSPSSWTILAMTNDGLVAFRHVGGIEGVQLVPDLAAELPAPSDSGRAYTFTLRNGIRYSTGKLVQATDFRTAIERVLEVKTSASDEGQYFRDIVGAAACKVGRPCDLSKGIVADDATGTVTFHLTRPDGDFLSKLALTGADAVPAGTPPPSIAHDGALPATGPYVVESYRKSRSLTLVRNRYFRQWSADAQPAGYPNRIAFSFFPATINGSTEAKFVEDGHADIAPELSQQFSKGQLAALATRYPSQLRLTPSPVTDFYFLNTRVRPFDDVRVRRAVNDALDRQKFVADARGLGYTPTCQVLPPDYPSYRRTCPYGPGGTAVVNAAKRLVRAAGQTGTKVTVWMPGPAGAQGRLMVDLLNAIGLRARVESLPFNAYFGRVFNPKTQTQIGFLNWSADFPSDGGFLPPLFSCVPGNASEFCDHEIDGLFAAAESAQALNPAAASGLWQRAERAVLAQAPIVPTDNPENIAFLAKGVHNFQFHPEWGVLLDQLWLK